MWQSTSSTQSIPPNLLKNFNPYDMLKPQKHGAKNSDAIKVDKLIDIDESSQDSGFHDLDSSLLNKNKEFDLIDVFENVLVTPQHIKVKSKKDEATVSYAPNVDFNELFDAIESGKKIDWTRPSSSKETASKHNDYEEMVKPKVLIPPVLSEPDLDPDEFIYEMLAQKNIKKQIFNDTKSNNNGCSSINKTRSVTTEGTRSTLNNNLNENFTLQENKHESKPSSMTDTTINKINNNFTVKPIKKDEKVYKKKRIVKPESQTSKFTKGPDFNEKSVVLPQIMARMIARRDYLEENNNIKRRLLLDSGTKTLLAESNIGNSKKEFVSDFSNAEKQLKIEKKATEIGVNAFKSESKKLTEAIISSANRSTKSAKTAENYINSVQNKSKRETHYGKLSPTVLMADCNKERLEAWHRSQLFKNFVLNGK